MKTWREHKANLARSVSLLPLGVTVPKEGVMPLNDQMWRVLDIFPGHIDDNCNGTPGGFSQAMVLR